MIPLIFGAVLVVGLIKPKGTIYIYDPVLNQNQAVGGVPDLFVLLAGGMNELERSIVEAIDTASANPYGTTGGMLSFNLVMSSIGATPDSIGLQKSVQQYYTDCGVFAIQTQTTPALARPRRCRSCCAPAPTCCRPSPSSPTRRSPPCTTPIPTTAAPSPAATRDWAALSVALTTPSTLQSMENTICSRDRLRSDQRQRGRRLRRRTVGGREPVRRPGRELADLHALGVPGAVG